MLHDHHRNAYGRDDVGASCQISAFFYDVECPLLLCTFCSTSSSVLSPAYQILFDKDEAEGSIIKLLEFRLPRDNRYFGIIFGAL